MSREQPSSTLATLPPAGDGEEGTLLFTEPTNQTTPDPAAERVKGERKISLFAE
jgi:hypothetical protein